MFKQSAVASQLSHFRSIPSSSFQVKSSILNCNRRLTYVRDTPSSKSPSAKHVLLVHHNLGREHSPAASTARVVLSDLSAESDKTPQEQILETKPQRRGLVSLALLSYSYTTSTAKEQSSLLPVRQRPSHVSCSNLQEVVACNQTSRWQLFEHEQSHILCCLRGCILERSGGQQAECRSTTRSIHVPMICIIQRIARSDNYKLRWLEGCDAGSLKFLLSKQG